MKQFDREEIAKKYNSIDKIWQENDRWHWFTFKTIESYIYSYLRMATPSPGSILNAGSGGNNYNLPEDSTTQIDLANEKLKSVKNAIVGTIEQIPRPDSSFDLAVCVGSVINYCDPLKTITELGRVLKNGGSLILEFENSRTMELTRQNGYNRNALIAKTFYERKEERIWYYSEAFIKQILHENGFDIIKIKRFHILSPLIYRITKKSNFSAFFAKFDRIARLVPLVNVTGSNVILIARKRDI